jgi:hypothetical protein
LAAPTRNKPKKVKPRNCSASLTRPSPPRRKCPPCGVRLRPECHRTCDGVDLTRLKERPLNARADRGGGGRRSFGGHALLPAHPSVLKSDSSVKLHFRHPTVPTHARFMSHDHLVVVDAENGRLWAHDFGERLRRSDTLFSTPTNAIIGTGDPIETLHHGTCVGRSIPPSVSDTLPDGSYIYYDTRGITHGNEKHELRIVSGDNTTVIQLDEDLHCMTISADWNRLLVLKQYNIEVYDFNRVLKCKSLDGGEISTIHLPKKPNSALFLANQQIV